MCIDKNSMIHAGRLIERTLHDKGRTVTWFAEQLCCTRPNVYKIFQKENIDIHDFFSDLSDSIDVRVSLSVSK